MKYLVTGGAGFIGSHVCEQLVNAGHEVVALDDFSSGKRENLAHLSSVEIREGNIADLEAFQDIGQFDGVFHLAAIASVEQCRQDWYGTHKVNLGGTVHLFSSIALTGRNIPVVYASSAAVYGDNPHIPLNEKEPAAPLSNYGQDKWSCEHAAAIAHKGYGIGSIGLRFFNVYGPRQDPKSPYSGVVSIFLDRFSQGKGITIYGDGGQTRDFIYVGDVVEALTRSMSYLHDAPDTQSVANVCTGRQTSVLVLATTLAGLYNITPEIDFQPGRQGDIRFSCGDTSHLEALLRFVPLTALSEGLRHML